jgi:hypothetical protein
MTEAVMNAFCMKDLFLAYVFFSAPFAMLWRTKNGLDMADLTDLVNSASDSLREALLSLSIEDPYKDPRFYFDLGGSNCK